MEPTRTRSSVESGDSIDSPPLGIMSVRSMRRLSALEKSFNFWPRRDADVHRDRCTNLVDSKCFEVMVTCTVLCNTLQMGLEVDYPGFKQVWDVGENIATSIFFCEMILKIIAKKSGYIRDRSNLLDAALTILGVIDCWVLASVPGANADLQSASILRILRLFRLARVSKLARKIKAIVLVFTGLYRALETTFWVLVGLVVIMFVFAIFCTEFVGRPEAGIYPGFSTDSEVIDEQEIMTNYNPHLLFGSMLSSMFTLFSIAIGSEWSDIVRPLAIKQPVFVVIFLLYCILIVFGIMNVIIAIVVDNVIEESRKLDHELDEAQKKKKVSLLHRIQGVLSHLDGSDDGQVSYEALKGGFNENSEFQELLKNCDFPAGWNARELLNLLDNNGDGYLEKSEFTTNVFRLMDSGDFQQLCMLQSGINQVKSLIRQSHSKLERQVKDIKEAVRRSEPQRFGSEVSDLTVDSIPRRPTQIGLAGAEDLLRQTSSIRLHRGFSEPLGDVLTSSSTAEQHTIEQLSVGGSLEKSLQQMRDLLERAEASSVGDSLEKSLRQMRDLLERTEAIVKTDSRYHAAVEKRQQLFMQAGSKGASQRSTKEQELLTRTLTAVHADAVCREVEHKIKRLYYEEFADILEAAFATMRETLQSMSSSGQERQSASQALDEEPSSLQSFQRNRRLSEWGHLAIPSRTTSQSDKVPRMRKLVNVPKSL